MPEVHVSHAQVESSTQRNNFLGMWMSQQSDCGDSEATCSFAANSDCGKQCMLFQGREERGIVCSRPGWVSCQAVTDGGDSGPIHVLLGSNW